MASVGSLRGIAVFGCVLAGLAVAAGAFGAHFLKSMLEPPMLVVFETAVRYQMYHAIGMVLAGLAGVLLPCPRLARVGWCFFAGILLFSGSLYLVTLLGIRWMGAVTPVGGSAFLAGWGLFGWTLWRECSTR